MRAALCLLLTVAGCPALDGAGGECVVDRDCDGGDVCARDHACHPASGVREVRTEWTIRGMEASELSCAGASSLYIQYHAGDDTLGFSPVPCELGLFNIDKLPRRFFSVELGVELGSGARHSAVTRAIDSEGRVQLDLEP